MNFRKPISGLLASLLFLSNAGLAMNVHYCGGEIASVSLSAISGAENAEDSCCGIFEQKAHCCKDKVLNFNKKTDQATVFAFNIGSAYYLTTKEWESFFLPSFPFNEREVSSEYSFQTNGPPLFKLYSQYIFYDRF